MKEIKIFCPATIANISCGFDVLGVALDSVGDEMVIRKVLEKGIRTTKLIGQDLPLQIEKNVAGVAGRGRLNALLVFAIAKLQQAVAIQPDPGNAARIGGGSD